MWQELFRIPIPGFLQHFLGSSLPVYGYGVMLVIGFFAGMQLAKYLARRVGIDPEIFVNAGLIALLTGVAGARLSHVLENLGQYTDSSRSAWANFMDAVNIRSGGLTFYGGFLLAFPCTVAYGMIKKVSIPLGMDIVAPCLMIGLGFGRIGCYLNGCCYGAICDDHVPWAVQFPYGSNAYLDQAESKEPKIAVPPALQVSPITGDSRPRSINDIKEHDPALLPLAQAQHSLPVHPAQLYSAVTAWLLAGILFCYFTTRPPAGRIFAMMLLLESPSRFILEMLRTEPPVIGPLSFSMVLSIGLFLMGIAMWFAFRPRSPRRASVGFDVVR